MEQEKPITGLVIGAHSADFIWRAGGAIALYAKRGWQITVVCMTFGEKGESQKLWKNAGMTLDRVKTARRAEAEKAGDILGVHDMQFPSSQLLIGLESSPQHALIQRRCASTPIAVPYPIARKHAQQG
jgi:LmbE family N-acetylglucosaminyl deacetylase